MNTGPKIFRFVATLSAVTLVLAACSGSTDNAVSQTPATSNSASASATPSQTVTPSPTATHPTPECGQFKDNSDQPLPTFKPTDVVYYLFACNEDNRVIVRVKDGKGQVVHADLYTSYTFGQISFDSGEPIETKTFLHGDGGFGTLPTYWGTPFDLHMDQLVRIVGPTTEIKAYYEQDCADYMATGSHKDCKKMGIGSSPRFIKEGDASKWVNEYAD